MGVKVKKKKNQEAMSSVSLEYIHSFMISWVPTLSECWSSSCNLEEKILMLRNVKQAAFVFWPQFPFVSA